jgi:hypothetical protein
MLEKYGICLTKAAMPLTKIDIDQLQRVNLNKYTTLILVNGDYSSLFSNNSKQNRTMDSKWRNTYRLSGGDKMALMNRKLEFLKQIKQMQKI